MDSEVDVSVCVCDVGVMGDTPLPIILRRGTFRTRMLCITARHAQITEFGAESACERRRLAKLALMDAGTSGDERN